MKNQALGMIETKGLVPAIEAGDAGVKAANVKLLGYEIVKGGLVMVAFTGEVAAVQASVSAGSAAAAKVGSVVSEHVIPRPEVDLRMVFKGNSTEPENDPPQPSPEGKGGSNKEDSPTPQESSLEDQECAIEESTEGQDSVVEDADLAAMTVGELRRLARKTPDITIHGREISRANKDQLMKEILRARGGKR